ncbi:MAG TPA: metal-sensitive transcriptional regulator [Mesotoga sp.]|jgi:DNA-binding FrmR family transcriptional regulator|nr:metal-sensitive transcriptional regulator [Mesotoga sp.]NLX34773.1 metal-sensitive transcriptional regulator [Thermotogaceae bacterium]MDD4040756.1 metal-sensitive transcriptional regulator [Mesotoga sp.]MDD4479475.1 metal-sensitive transcriptional regulator [Mesotoga sp.]MDD5743758.1 metal-sensitive transcriptional regulator [Mesotoga sp.]
MQGVDESTRKAVLNRLKRIEGQIRGLQKMVENDRVCGDILTQVSAVNSALSRVSEMIIKGYARKCVIEANEAGKTEELDNLIENIIKLRGI